MISLMPTDVLWGRSPFCERSCELLKKTPKRLYGAFLLLTREAYVAVGR